MNRQDRSASNDNTEGDDANIVSPVAVAGSSLESEVAAPAASLPSRTPTIRQLSFASPVAAVPEAFTSPSSTPVNTSASTIPPQAMHPALVSEVAKLLVGGYNENTSPPVATSTATGTHPINSNSEVVKLNVGGCKFTTSRSTLRRVPGTHFEAMFSGRHAFAASQDEEGQYFIDRDGKCVHRGLGLGWAKFCHRFHFHSKYPLFPFSTLMFQSFPSHSELPESWCCSDVARNR